MDDLSETYPMYSPQGKISNYEFRIAEQANISSYRVPLSYQSYLNTFCSNSRFQIPKVTIKQLVD